MIGDFLYVFLENMLSLQKYGLNGEYIEKIELERTKFPLRQNIRYASCANNLIYLSDMARFNRTEIFSDRKRICGNSQIHVYTPQGVLHFKFLKTNSCPRGKAFPARAYEIDPINRF